jgi:hypothetical protein
MKLKKLGLVLVAILALAAVVAGSAQANWEIEGKAFTEGQKEKVSVEATETFTLKSKILGSEFVLTASKLSCKEGVECLIDQKGAVDHSSGVLSFSGLTVDKPAGCVVAGPINTLPLTDELIMDPSGGTATFDKFFPESGTTFVEIEVTGCAAAGKYPVTGTVTGLSNNTGVGAVSQPLTFSAANQTTGGGALKLGKEAAELSGKAVNKLAGANVGKVWSGK